MKVQPNKSSTQASVGVTCKSKKNTIEYPVPMYDKD